MAGLVTDFVGREILYFPKLLSTNATAREQAEAGAKEGTAVIAETQTEGRGRLQRPWISPKGGIWLSIILRPKISAQDAQKMALTTAVAIAKTLNKRFAVKAQIKWPNDVLIGNKKVCGILIETTIRGKMANVVIVGIGINANFSVQALPGELRATATTLQDVMGRRIDMEELIRDSFMEVEDYYNLLKARKFETLMNDWRSLAGFLGSEVEVTGFGKRLRGIALDIDEDGALIIKLDTGENRRIVSGDVSVRWTS